MEPAAAAGAKLRPPVWMGRGVGVGVTTAPSPGTSGVSAEIASGTTAGCTAHAVPQPGMAVATHASGAWRAGPGRAAANEQTLPLPSNAIASPINAGPEILFSLRTIVLTSPPSTPNVDRFARASTVSSCASACHARRRARKRARAMRLTVT